MSEVLGVAPVDGAPIISPAVAEPSIEALASLLPDPTPSAVALPGAERDIPVPPQAPPKQEGEAPAEAKNVVEPTKTDEPVVDKEALDRAEAAAKKAREGSRRYREMLDAQRRVQAEAERAAREAAENRRKAEEAARFQDELRKDPYAALKRLGMTDQELAERALREGTPENELRVQLQRQQEALEAERQRIQQLEQRLESERQATHRQQAEAKFHRLADDDRAYPRLAQLAPTAQLAVAQAALRQIANNGYDVSGLSDEAVAEACERFLAPKKQPTKVATAKPSIDPPVTPAPKATTTLTNAVSTTRATAPRAWEDLSDDEQIAAIAAALPDPG